MKWNMVFGALVVSVGLCSQSFGFELLDRMIGLNDCGCNSCCQKAPSCGCDKGCEPACAAAPSCAAEQSCCAAEASCCAAPSCCKSRCKRHCNVLGHLHDKFFGCGCKKSCNSCNSCAAAPSCGCAAEPACAAAAPSCAPTAATLSLAAVAFAAASLATSAATVRVARGAARRRGVVAEHRRARLRRSSLPRSARTSGAGMAAGLGRPMREGARAGGGAASSLEGMELDLVKDSSSVQ